MHRIKKGFQFPVQCWMQEALKEACKAFHEGEVPVGAVFVKDGSVVAKARNTMHRTANPLAHAEMNLAAMLVPYGPSFLEGGEVYITLEPCGMCAHALGKFPFARLVFGAYACTMQIGASNLMEGNTNHGYTLEVFGGILERPCQRLLRRFFQKKRMQVSENTHIYRLK